MTSDRRKLLRFGVQFLLWFPVFLWLYAAALPVYTDLILGAANRLLEHREPAIVLEPNDDGGWGVFVRPFGDIPMVLSRESLTPGSVHLLFLNLAVLPALLLAMPVPWRRRFELLAMAVPLVLACHVAVATALVPARECSGTNALCRWLFLAVLGTSGQVLGFVQWGLLTWGYWIRQLRGAEPRRAKASA